MENLKNSNQKAVIFEGKKSHIYGQTKIKIFHIYKDKILLTVVFTFQVSKPVIFYLRLTFCEIETYKQYWNCSVERCWQLWYCLWKVTFSKRKTTFDVGILREPGKYNKCSVFRDIYKSSLRNISLRDQRFSFLVALKISLFKKGNIFATTLQTILIKEATRSFISNIL